MNTRQLPCLVCLAHISVENMNTTFGKMRTLVRVGTTVSRRFAAETVVLGSATSDTLVQSNNIYHNLFI